MTFAFIKKERNMQELRFANLNLRYHFLVDSIIKTFFFLVYDVKCSITNKQY